MDAERLSGFGWLVASALLTLGGCKDNQTETIEKNLEVATAPKEKEEQSPNARILPEPLEDPAVAPRRDDAPDDDESDPPRPRPRPEPFPVGSALTSEELAGVRATGYTLQARFVWPEADRRAPHQKNFREPWPTLRVELVRELRQRTALTRWVVENDVLLLPRDTELRARADRVGQIIVWPDQRSYRVVPRGALRTVFEERRVDRMPFVESQVSRTGTGQRLGRATQRHKIETPLGVAHWETIHLPDAHYAAGLYCKQVLELLRVQAHGKLCQGGHLPIRVYAEWAKGGQFLFEVTELTAGVEFQEHEFRIPPPLPIFKRGELPPFDSELLLAAGEGSDLPVKQEGEELAPDPPPVRQVVPPPVEEAPPDPTRSFPGDLLVVQNHEDRPLLVLLKRTPAFWLYAGQERRVRLRPGPVSLVARDFMGELVVDAGVVTTPKEVHLSRSGTTAAGPAP